jgi:uncharacterized membrane protein
LEYLELAAATISLSGVVVIVGGFLWAVRHYVTDFRDLGPVPAFKDFKVGMGQALLLGLEILIVADVIETITTESTFAALGVLAILVVIRTIISWTLSLDVEGRWPWQAAEGE